MFAAIFADSSASCVRTFANAWLVAPASPPEGDDPIPDAEES